MRIQHLTEHQNNLIILESLGLNEDPYYVKWMNDIHPVLVEVALNPEQIKQLFKNIETTASDQGSNRSGVGKAVDAAGELTDKAKELWFDKLGGMLQNSAPVKAFDEKWEEIKTKVAAKNPELAAKLAKYGEFAKNNPKLHKFLLAVGASLAASVGVALAGGVGASALAIGTGAGVATGIVNIADRLLKGEKASTAIGRGGTAGLIAGLTAGAMAKIGQFASGMREKSIPFGTEDTGLEMVSWKATSVQKSFGQELKQMTQGFNVLVRPEEAEAIRTAIKGIQAGEPGSFQTLMTIAREVHSKDYKIGMHEIVAGAWDAAKNNDSLMQWIKGLTQAATAGSGAVGTAAASAGEKKESYYVQTRPLSEGQVYLLLRKISEQQQLDEGPMDWLKKGAAAVGKGVAAVGKQITTNATYPKLLAAWKLEGSPTDSEELKKFLQNYGGITPEVIDKVYTDMKLSGETEPKPAEGELPADDPRVKDLAKRSTEALTQWLEQAKRTGTMDPALIKSVEAELKKRGAPPPPGAAPAAGPVKYDDIKKMVMSLDKKSRQRLIPYIQKQLGTA